MAKGQDMTSDKHGPMKSRMQILIEKRKGDPQTDKKKKKEIEREDSYDISKKVFSQIIFSDITVN